MATRAPEGLTGPRGRREVPHERVMATNAVRLHDRGVLTVDADGLVEVLQPFFALARYFLTNPTGRWQSLQVATA
jgi:hypothetical protein